MAVNDPVADMLTRIRNGVRAKHRYVDIPWSRLKQQIAEIMRNKGFVENFITKVDPHGRGVMRLFLKYREGGHCAIQGLRRVSKPGLRRYVGYKEIPHFYGNLGVPILSTSTKGVIAGDEASGLKVGGELLCLVW